MKRYLLVASLDVKRQPNNREHHLINHIAPRFSEAWVVYRKRDDQGDHSRHISQLLFTSSKVHRQRAGLTFFEVDPMFNSPPNMAMEVTQSYQTHFTPRLPPNDQTHRHKGICSSSRQD